MNDYLTESFLSVCWANSSNAGVCWNVDDDSFCSVVDDVVTFFGGGTRLIWVFFVLFTVFLTAGFGGSTGVATVDAIGVAAVGVSGFFFFSGSSSANSASKSSSPIPENAP